MKSLLILLTIFALFSASVHGSDGPATEPPTESTDENPEQLNQFLLGSEDMIASIYRRAFSQAVDTKVKDLQSAIQSGDNLVPAALDILKLTLLSNPTQMTIRKTAEHILSIMSPDTKKMLFTVMANPAKFAQKITDEINAEKSQEVKASFKPAKSSKKNSV